MRSRLLNCSSAISSVRDVQKGFTLLEVLVSLAILGLGLAVILQGLALGLRVRRESSEAFQLGSVAESRLNQLLSEGKASAGSEEGEERGYRWKKEVVQHQASENETASQLAEVRLLIESPSGKKWELITLVPLKKDKH